jgi:hypothetical protein
MKSSVPSVTTGRKMDSTSPPAKKKSNNSNHKAVRVRFADPHIQIHLVRIIPNRKELTKDEMKSIYFSRKDLKRIRHDIVNTLKILGKQKRFDTPLDTMRGLECFVPSYADKRDKRIDFARAAVVKRKQQPQLWMISSSSEEEEAEDTDERMAEMYRSISAPSVCLAALRGRKDQLATTTTTCPHSPTTSPATVSPVNLPSSIQ